MSSYLPAAVKQPIVHCADLLRGALGGISWGPALSVSKAAVTSLFKRIENGTLVVVDDTTGTTETFGEQLPKEFIKSATNGVNGTKTQSNGAKRVELRIRKESFWVRLFLFADMGFAEAYMLGEMDCADLTAFFQVRGCRYLLPVCLEGV